MYSIVYIVIVVFLAFVKANNTNIYSFLNAITEFNEKHIVNSIIVPIIQFAYQMLSSTALSVLSYNMKFAKVMDVVYANLTESQRSFYSILLYGFEIVVYLLVTSAYFALFASGLGVVSNIKNKNEETNVNNKIYVIIASVSLFIIVLHGWSSNWLDKNYIQKPRELVKKTLVALNLTLFTGISLVTLLYFMRRQQVELPSNLENLTKMPLAKMVGIHVLLTIVLQTVFYTFHVIKAGTSDESINHSIRKEQIFASVMYVLASFL